MTEKLSSKILFYVLLAGILLLSIYGFVKLF
jgi:hypothetical protein